MDLNNYKRITVITGAGISAPSGLPTFRGKEDSLWNDVDFMNKSNIDYLRAHPEYIEEATGYWFKFRDMMKDVEPNPAHLALAKAEENHVMVIGTQNVDGLHQKAGSTAVHELHGSLFRCKCVYCDWGESYPEDWWDRNCPDCGGPMRSAAVMFGEQLPLQAVAYVEKAVINSDLVMYVGTSGQVYPVAGFVDVANGWGVPTILVNDEEWEHPHPGFNEKIFGPCEVILPELFGL